METRLRDLEDWRLEMQVSLKVMRQFAKAIFGVSLLSAIGTIITIFLLIRDATHT